MREIQGNPWSFHSSGYPIVITTNGSVKKDGSAVMGRGVALQANMKLPGLALAVGAHLSSRGNHVFWLPQFNLFTFPVKREWSQAAIPELIAQSSTELLRLVDQYVPTATIYMPRPGCGNGWLDWGIVKPVISDVLDDRFVIVEIAWKAAPLTVRT